jgi:phosphoribosylformylglycinamidine cyclo-ligase
MSYRDAGVDLDAAERSTESLKALVNATADANTLSQLGAFGGLYAVPGDVPDPVLVSSTDSVGTKIKMAFMTGIHDTIGQDIVNHCVNDILVQGARPIFFLDYLGVGKLNEDVVADVVRGVAVACRENSCALLGGETAELSELYAPDEYDLAGFIVGIVSRDRVIDGSRIQSGDVLVGLEASGLHTNGYTLARQIVFDAMGLHYSDELPGTGRSVQDELLTIHRSYLAVFDDLLDGDTIHGLAHITGGGIPGNLPRVLPDRLGAIVDRSTWEVPAVFRALREGGAVERDEMDRVFNMGIGMIAVVSEADVDAVVDAARLRGHGAPVIGRIHEGSGVQYE